MILDSIDNIDKYKNISKDMEAGLNFLFEHRNGGLEKGDYPISEGAYAKVRFVRTKEADKCTYESHKDYIDIQYVVRGKEFIGWAPRSKMTVESYIEDKDQYVMSGSGSLVPLTEKQFMILFPDDVHMPSVCYDEPDIIEKIIIKVKV